MASTPITAVNARSVRESRAPVQVRELGLVDYEEAWELQRGLAQARAEGGQDVALLLEHPFVYTAGKRTEPGDLPFNGAQVVEVDRGGKITWHGPGQIVGYPIVKLAEPIDVISYVRTLEDALISACAHFGVRATRVEGNSGVWLPSDGRRIQRKIGSIGVRVQRGVTLHGFSLNCDADLSAFANIVPCGIPDVGATSLSAETDRQVTVAEAQPVVVDRLLAALDGKLASHR
ncbi:lipoyl(octanoyl) transferase LipB [Segniliparus rugosus]|uniref:Octanoyltransferase n=1 Tax=Segniliparus rugosus (strain ATCC BAA-974 / DSM 45345 / CCUG 50838 / CIP 108380 / JCM 13579 / CDC 945) TaxID=679197 RepID=E5XRE9_SEGRC|nr:lipoyl(octanoyl) transferase LipB [Segniliparus rugosus]EFV13082.2 lipoyl(octanoyl) transferase [Segniliparus rugosus ATCC BAA-974]